MGRDLLTLPPSELQKIRGKDIAMVFQDPFACLHPMYRVGDQIAEAVLAHSDVEQGRREGARSRDARSRRHPEREVAGARLPAPVLGRHAPARDDRDGARAQPVDPDLRRADDRARRDRAGADPRADRGGEARVRHRRHPRDARPRSRRGDRELGHGHVRGARSWSTGPARRDLRAAAASVRLGAPRLDADDRAPARGARADRGLAAVAPRPAVGLPVPSPLPIPLRAVPDRAPAARRAGARGAPRRLPPAVGARRSSRGASVARVAASSETRRRERRATTSSRSST